jgi:hypothetical protein
MSCVLLATDGRGRKLEFLTHEITCASEMPEKTTCENFCQKRPPAVNGGGGMPGYVTCRAATSPAANDGGGMVLPPNPPLPYARVPPMATAAGGLF